MRYVKFQVVSDNEFGGVGILPNIFLNWDNYSPSIARNNLGHDLIEHGCRETGAFYQEVAATGSFMFGRVLSGMSRSSLSPHSRIVSNFHRDWQDSRGTLLPPTPKVLILDKETNEMLDKVFEGMRDEAIRVWESETSGTFDDEDEDRDCPYTTDENWPKVLGWLKFGYARAKQRYKEDYIAYQLVNNIDKVIENEWPMLEQYQDTGKEFSLAIDIENGTAELVRGERDYF